MAHPMKGIARSSDPKWLGRLQKATGGGVALGRRGNKESATFSKTDDTVPTTTRFLPKYDFDYDPTGGERTGQMTNFGQSDEIQSHKRSLDNPINDRKRGGKVTKRADGGEVGFRTQMKRPAPVEKGTDEYWDRQGLDTMANKVTTTARQIFKDGSEGPMNVNPFPIKGERK